MKKFRLLRDLPFAEAGRIETEGWWWKVLPVLVNIEKTGWFEEVKERWEPKEGELKYFVEYLGLVNASTFFTPEQKSFGNYFRTKELAEGAAKVIKEALDKYHDEIGE